MGREVIYEGWLQKRGPMAQMIWQDRWCVLENDDLKYYTDETRKLIKGNVPIRPRETQALALTAEGAPGDALKHRESKPSGFVIDPWGPAAGSERRFFYFAAKDGVQMKAWINAISSAGQEKSSVNGRTASADAEDEEDEINEEEFERQVQAHQKGRKQGAICSEKTEVDPNWKAPVFQKTPQQDARLRSAVSKCFMFSALSSEDLATVLLAFEEVSSPKGSTIIQEGAKVTLTEPALFILESGRLEVFKGGAKEAVFAYESPGQYFGDLALLYNAPRAATVVAASDAKLWAIDRNTFNYLVKDAARQATRRQAEFLRRVPLLSELSPDEIAALSDAIKVRIVEEGSVIFKEGDAAKEMFIIERGKVEAKKGGNTVRYHYPKSYFGELAFLHDSTRAAEVVALEKTKLLVLDAESVKRLLGSLGQKLREKAATYGDNLVDEQDDAEDDDDEMQMDDEEFERQILAHQKGKTHKAISAETVERDPNWQAPVHQKAPEEKARLEAALAKCFLFSSLPKDILEDVILAFKETPVAAGSTVIKQGDTVNATEPALFVFESGKLDVFKDDSKEPVAAYNSAGQYFGDLALLYNAPRAATVVAAEASKLWSIDRNTFNFMVRDASIAAKEGRRKSLANVPLLRGLSGEELYSLTEAFETRRVKAGTMVVCQGDEGKEMFFVQKGRCEARKDGVVVKNYPVRAYFGELALLNNAPRAADVVATEDSILLVLGATAFSRLLGPLKKIMEERATKYSDEAVGEDEEEEADDDMDDEEFEKMIAAHQHKGKHNAISAEHTDVDPDWKAPVFEKSEGEEARLRRALSKCFMFASLAEEDLHTVLLAFKETPVFAGTTVIEQGAMVSATEDALFVLEKGTLDVFKKGVETPVFTYTKPGQFFGDLALLYNAPRAATVVAKEDSKLWAICRNTFNVLVKDAARQARERRMAFLGKVPLLKDLTEDEKSTLSDAIQVRLVTSGARVVRKGQAGREMFIIERGKCEARDEGGVPLLQYSAKSYFGELALINSAPRAADVVATEASRLLVLDSDTVKRLLGPLDDLMRKRAEAYGSQLKDDVEDEDEDDEMDPEEFERMVEKHQRAGRHLTVCADVYEAPSADWKPPVHEKSAEEEARVKAALERSFMFSSLADNDLQAVIKAFKATPVKTGARVIDQGGLVKGEEPALFVLETGSLDVFKKGSEAPVFTYCTPGQTFGDLALLYNAPRAATVIASKDCMLWSICRSTFNVLVLEATKRAVELRKAFLKDVSALKDMSPDDLASLNDVLQGRVVEAGVVVSKAGEGACHDLFIVESGRCEAKRDGEVVSKYAKAGCFGMHSVVGGASADCDVVAAETTRLLVLGGASKGQWAPLLEKNLKAASA
eukprot:TRINITY_DN36481_c0_g1_i1.p1 TRINITY_DN36481_c0_g1~~TRINITY_DN36481_c0_g1_i1.p1  ORF type:complete len:1368 (+),score=470.48 TRINITY_DN36481_c0_g1_i1:85-4188(+)